MEQVVVKTEIQNNGEILLYYVDENGENQQGVVTTMENGIQIQDNYILSNLEDFVDDSPLQQAEIDESEPPLSDWSDEDTKRLLIFYNDNKQSFLASASTKKKHLWSVACKTMLIGKDHESCELQLQEMKSKYAEVRGYTEKGIYVKWPLLDLCHKAFHDDIAFNSFDNNPTKARVAVLKQDMPKTDTTRVVKQINNRTVDEKVEQMLNFYLKYKHKFQKEHWRKDLWDTIALEMGQAEDGEYWHKRFLNYKQHYIGMLLKQRENGSNTVSWPYMDLFDKIFEDDVNFHKKYFNTSVAPVNEHGTKEIPQYTEIEWTRTHITVLGKYYFDSYEEFKDPTVPDMFLWTEVGRLIDMKPESCMEMYGQLREEHIEKYLAGGYSLQNRTAIAIILDNIIARDVKKQLMESQHILTGFETSKITLTDELVQFFYENIEVFKDSVCYFVCWEVIAKKLKEDIGSCKRQWDELVSLYNSIMEDKKDNPDMQIDWRYIEMFDRIFDYGMDVDFIKGYSDTAQHAEAGRVGVKKITIKTEADEGTSKAVDDQNLNSPRTDPRSTKILEFYLKNKDKFQHLKNKLALWEPLAKDIKINSTQCAHRFRHLKQTFIDNVQKEIDNPKAYITWPYYALCKKVFGYRSIKNKLKQGTLTADSDDWLARELKQLISFFSKNFHQISNNIDDISKWGPVATELGKSQLSCKDKFVELRKCYRKLKTMKTRNPDVKISWSHFAMFDRIYSEKEGVVAMDVETMEEEHLEMDGLEMGEGGEDDYQCIIVLQEGQDLTDINNAQIIIQNPTQMLQETEVVPEKLPEELPKPNTWTNRTKKLLLIHYINYMRSHRGKKINQKHLWEEMAAKISNKTHIQCKKMFIRLKNTYKNSDEEKQKSHLLHTLMEKVLKIKPKISISPIKDAKIQKTYKDVEMQPSKVESALNYYLNHIDDFVDPKFEKKYLWTELANHISEPVNKVYNKINYLKQAYNVETEEIDGQKTQWNGILNEIIVKEVSMNVLLDGQTNKHYFDDDESNWSADLTESLLTWYLGNLDKFKNPKFDRSYLWMEASAILSKSPVVCSKKMSEIRTQYRNMVKNNSDELENWRFYELCQKIYGTGKKSSESEH